MTQSAIPSQTGTQSVNQTTVQPDIAQISVMRRSLRRGTLSTLPKHEYRHRTPSPLRMVNWSVQQLPKTLRGRLLIPKNPARKRFMINQTSVSGPGILLFSFGVGNVFTSFNNSFAQIALQLGQIWDEPGSLINYKPAGLVLEGAPSNTFGMNVSTDDIYIYYTGNNPINVAAYEGVLA